MPSGVVAPLMVLPHVPAAPPVPYFHSPVVPGAPVPPPPPPPLPEHNTWIAPPMSPYPVCPAGYAPPPQMIGYSPAPTAYAPQMMGYATTAASSAKQYEVQVKLEECRSEGDKVIDLPKLTVLEGQPATASTTANGNVGLLRVRVESADADRVGVAVSVSKRASQKEAEGAVTICQSCRAYKMMKIGEPVRIPVSKSTKCAKWLVVCVKECGADKKSTVKTADECTDSCGPIRMVEPRLIINEEEEANAAYETSDKLAREYFKVPCDDGTGGLRRYTPPQPVCPLPAALVGTEAARVGYTVPSARYLQHPPQYIPPQPPFPLPAGVVEVEAAAAKACNEAVRCAAYVVTPWTPEVAEKKCETGCRIVTVTRDGCLEIRSDDCVVRGATATLNCKDVSLSLRADEVNGRKRVCIEAECDLEAVADRLTVDADGKLVMDGDVRIMCASPASGKAERVEAGRVIMELDNGKMKRIQVVPEK
jgi:hypothetical protein